MDLSEATKGTAAPNHPAVEPKQAETVGPSEACGLVKVTGGTLDVETKQAESVCLLEVTEGVSAAHKPAGRTNPKNPAAELKQSAQTALPSEPTAADDAIPAGRMRQKNLLIQ
jgi:hypothetical protein